MESYENTAPLFKAGNVGAPNYSQAKTKQKNLVSGNGRRSTLFRNVSTALLLSGSLGGCANIEVATQLYPPGEVVDKNFECSAHYANTKELTEDSAAGNLDTEITNTKNVRNNYARFLRCREQTQNATGVAVIALSGGALGLAAAGIKHTTAAALGALAGTGLGLDYVLYNKSKTKAYATAVAQLECVIEKGKEAKTISASSAYTRILNLQTKFDSKIDAFQKCSCELKPEDLYLITKKKVLFRDNATLRSMNYTAAIGEIPEKIKRARRMIDVSAFAAAQDGVPDGEQLKAAVAAIAQSIPAASATSTTDAQAQKMQLQGVPVPKASQCSEQYVSVLNAELDALFEELKTAPDPSKIDIETCLTTGSGSGDTGGTDKAKQ